MTLCICAKQQNETTKDLQMIFFLVFVTFL